MSLSKFVVGRPTTLLIIFVLMILFGLYVASNLAIDLFPEINPPILVVFSDSSVLGPGDWFRISSQSRGDCDPQHLFDGRIAGTLRFGQSRLAW